jgi:hypothetical protein
MRLHAKSKSAAGEKTGSYFLSYKNIEDEEQFLYQPVYRI